MSSLSQEERRRWLIAMGQAIREFRISLGVSQEVLGYRAGLHRTYVSDLERGQRNATALTLVQLSKPLGVQPSEILKRSEEILAEGRRGLFP